MTYVYRHKDGTEIEREFTGDRPESIRIGNRRFHVHRIAAPQVCIPEQHRADYYAGREGEKRRKREMEHNSKIARGLADGSMIPNFTTGQPIIGEAMTREAITTFNRIYEDAKETAPKKKYEVRDTS